MFVWICFVGQREIYDEKKSLFVGMELSQARLVVSPLHNLSIATSKPVREFTSAEVSTLSCRLMKRIMLVLLLVCANDIQTNPGPNFNDSFKFNMKDFTRARGLKVAHINIRSVINKTDTLEILLKDKSFDVFTVSETWLKPQIPDCEVNISGYSCVRQDRLEKIGGGTMIYVRDGVPYRHRQDLGGGVTESCVIEITRPKCKKLLIWTVYRAPNTNLEDAIEKIQDRLLNIPDSFELVLLGDFNVNFLEVDKTAKRKLMRIANLYDLEQLILQPTRITPSSKSLIDLLFTNSCHRVVDCGVINLTLSDHSLIFCVLKSGCPKAPGRSIQYRAYKNYSKANFVNELKEINWETVENDPDINAAVNKWNALFTKTANHHAPLKQTRLKGVSHPWMNSQLSKEMQYRDKLYKSAIKLNTKEQWHLYKKQKNFVNRETRRCKSEYYTKLIDENKQNSSALWKTLNQVTSRKRSPCIACVESEGIIYSDTKSMATIFNEYFASIGTRLANRLRSLTTVTTRAICSTRNWFNSNMIPKFELQPVCEQFVYDLLRQLKVNKAIGLDEISPRLLKDSAHVITPSLTRLFNRSLANKMFPSIWKKGKVSPLFKSGDRCDPNNYRPITVLPALSKIMEKLVHIQLYSYLNENNLITSEQFGFRPTLSTGLALTQFTDSILGDMDAGRFTGAVFLDLSKAFDTVDHAILLDKLRSLGVDEDSLNWFRSYLSERSQVTSISDSISSPLPMSVGVPQGSILGLLLCI